MCLQEDTALLTDFGCAMVLKEVSAVLWLEILSRVLCSGFGPLGVGLCQYWDPRIHGVAQPLAGSMMAGGLQAPELIVSEEGRSAEVQLRCNPLAADSFSYGFLLFEWCQLATVCWVDLLGQRDV